MLDGRPELPGQRLVAREVVQQHAVLAVFGKREPKQRRALRVTTGLVVRRRPPQGVPDQVDAEQPPQLRDRLHVVVDAQVADPVDAPCGLSAAAPTRSTTTAADCWPRLSPPASCPASRATTRRSASVPVEERNALSISVTTASPARMFLDRVARADAVTRPGQSTPIRCARRAAVRGYGTQLTRLAALVALEHVGERVAG